MINMTEADYDSRIAGQRAAAAGYQQEIRNLEEQIGELEQFRTEMGSLQDTLHDAASGAERSVTGIAGLLGWGTALINQQFFSGILSVVKGSEYSAADSGLSASQDKIDAKIRELRSQISQKQAAIRTCNANVVSLETEKADYMVQKAAEEAAMAAQGEEA